MTTETDDITRRRIDSGSEPDYYLLQEIKGYRMGTSGKARWDIGFLDWSDNIDPEDKKYIADILEKVVEVLRQ